MFEYENLKLIWWLLVGLLLVGFATMDGHDMGVGTLLPFVGRDDIERRIVIKTVAPHWEGNQVWLITAGGAIFAVWPLVYATAFSGFYWPMLAALWALFFRPVGFDYRDKIHNATWRCFWDWGLFISGVIPPLILGIAFGNLLQGIPFSLNSYLISTFTGSFWQLLNPFALLAGVVSSAMITLQGATYLSHRTEGAIQSRCVKAGVWSALIMVFSFCLAGQGLKNIEGYRITSVIIHSSASNPLTKTVVKEAGAWLTNYHQQPLLWTLPILGVFGAVNAAAMLLLRKTLPAFISSCLAVIGVISTAGASLFPFIIPSSTMPDSSLTIWDSSSSHLSLGIMLLAACIFIPLVIIYTSWTYGLMRGKITAAHIQTDEHSAY